MADLTKLFDPVPRPEGPFRVLLGQELETQWVKGHRTRRDLLFQHQALAGHELADVHPVPLAGDPEDEANLRAVGVEHRASLAAFWNKIVENEGNLPQDVPRAAPPVAAIPADCARYVDPTAATVFYDPGDRCHLIMWSEDLIARVAEMLKPQGFLPFASDGAGLVFAVASDGRVVQSIWVPMRQSVTARIGGGLDAVLAAASQ